jgi:hypothetical protein
MCADIHDGREQNAPFKGPNTDALGRSSHVTAGMSPFKLEKLTRSPSFQKRRPQFNWWTGKADGNTAVPFRRSLSSIERGGYGASGTQLIILSAASQRDVRGVELPANVNVEGEVARKVVDTQ